jgi:hypothetical protein
VTIPIEACPTDRRRARLMNRERLGHEGHSEPYSLRTIALGEGTADETVEVFLPPLGVPNSN